ncbi:Plasmid stabilization system [Sulfurimonas denitrificans DSM 1251]|uniref:Plasmid stabilization system n=1 Tax=Sulfurimonas denitrificans (strain ATCC 33889 / DSM 1251) TaxID=326298 RepID=Q30SD7_SULDN|nr:type II toxin-antitoxin system RelE/ParE family toxin [Sulfurimonas denitrificans]ABB44094.1 Plasmid stabilization system [Sulfurimonas denitrificans DSM 1251]
MRIEKNPFFNDRLFSILKYIAINNPANAKKFKKELDQKIINLVNMPFKYRQSIHYDDINVRDLIFKGYTIPYLIDNDMIVILDIFKWENK